MNTNDKDNFKTDLPKDALVNMLMHAVMHAATREDLAELKRETKQDAIRLEDKIENLKKDMNTQFKWTIGLMFLGFFSMTGVLGALIKLIN